MTEQERKEMLILADMIQGEINRMCVTHELSELDTMALHARKNIKKLQAMRYKDFKGEIDAFAGAVERRAKNDRRKNSNRGIRQVYDGTA